MLIKIFILSLAFTAFSSGAIDVIGDGNWWGLTRVFIGIITMVGCFRDKKLNWF